MEVNDMSVRMSKCGGGSGKGRSKGKKKGK